jgi:hypothetical protein
MPYKPDFISTMSTVESQTDGANLGREAIRLDFSVTRIVTATGATRQTIYNWFAGKPIAPYYAERVRTLLNILVSADTAENAWRKACSKFDLKT